MQGVSSEILYLNTFSNYFAQIHLHKIGQTIWKMYLDKYSIVPTTVCMCAYI